MQKGKGGGTCCLISLQEALDLIHSPSPGFPSPPRHITLPQSIHRNISPSTTHIQILQTSLSKNKSFLNYSCDDLRQLDLSSNLQELTINPKGYLCPTLSCPEFSNSSQKICSQNPFPHCIGEHMRKKWLCNSLGETDISEATEVSLGKCGRRWWVHRMSGTVLCVNETISFPS